MTSYDPNQDPYNGQPGPGSYPSDPGYPQYPNEPQPGAYAPGMSPYGPSTEKNALGGWALGLGIASLACCGSLLIGVPAIVLGILGIQAANEGRASNKGMAIAGLIMGVLSIVATVIAWTTGIMSSILDNL